MDVARLRHQSNLGVLMTPRGRHSRAWLEAVNMTWAADNDAFSQFNAEAFIRMLGKLRGIPGCLFVSLPDVVGHAGNTLRRFHYWRPIVRKFAYPIALVAQDGLENESIPWSLFDALFIGGTTTWKLSRTTSELIQEARRRKKWVHMGRVNSYSRIRYADSIGVQSIDGTHFSREPSQIERKLPALQVRQLCLPGILNVA